jgi:hypothetical protein
MTWKWTIIALTIFAAILIGTWIAKRNKKDRRSLVRELDSDYRKQKVDEPQI